MNAILVAIRNFFAKLRLWFRSLRSSAEAKYERSKNEFEEMVDDAKDEIKNGVKKDPEPVIEVTKITTVEKKTD